MRGPKLVRAELSVHVHATEDENKVVQAVRNIVSSEDILKASREVKEVLEGHYSNPITRIRLEISGENAEKLLSRILKALDEHDKRVLVETLDRRYDEKGGRLYIRLSKQDAYLGEVRLMDGDDVIRIMFVFRGAPSISDIRRFLEELQGLMI